MATAFLIAACVAAGGDLGMNPCGGSATDECETHFERLCTEDGNVAACDCHCDPDGWWSRRAESVIRSPAQPADSGAQVVSTNLTRWNWRTYAMAAPGHAEASMDLAGHSTFWHSGSMTKSVSARQATIEREMWAGEGTPCPRLVQLAATGGGLMELSLTCTATVGCAASGSVTIGGSCSSLGRANASIEGKTVHGTVGYRSYSRRMVATGKLGTSIDDDGIGIDGKISSEDEWKIDGDGSVSGTAAYIVTPDRTYCAFTNKSIIMRSMGTVAMTAGGSVDDNGSISISAVGIVALSVH